MSLPQINDWAAFREHDVRIEKIRRLSSPPFGGAVNTFAEPR